MTPTPTPTPTLPQLLRRNALGHAGETALREKHLGIWRSITWAEYHGRTRLIALGLRALGLAPGEVVGLIGDNRPEWIMGEIAVHALGCQSLGLYRDSLDEEVEYLLSFSAAAAVLCEDEEQVDKLLASDLPGLRHIVFSDPRGMRKLDDPRLISLDALMGMGAKAPPEDYDALLDAMDPEACAILCTTSGTTARPKLARLSSVALVRHCEAAKMTSDIFARAV